LIEVQAATILVVDDDPMMVTLLQKALAAVGHRVLLADRGEQALAFAASEHPDLVLLDRNMPGLGGVETMQKLKAASGAAWTPVIMMSADGSAQSQVEALKLGCDDYLTKPVNLFVLTEKIAAFLRVLELHRMISRQKTELQSYRDHAEEEATITRFLLGRLVGEDTQSDPDVSQWIQPSAQFSGDLVAHGRSPGGELYSLLADATGHGLPAAVTLVPMIRIFHTMAARGFNLQTIATELNRLVHEYTPIDRFVAVTLSCCNPREHTLAVINAGNPPAFLYSGGNILRRAFDSRSIALGILDNHEFHPQSEVCEYEDDDYLVVYSDGLTEAVNAGQQAFSGQGIVQSLALRGSLSPQQAILAAFRQHMQGMVAHDDVSLQVVRCPSCRPVCLYDSSDSPATDSAWQLEFVFGVAQLQTLDVVPTVIEVAKAMGLTAASGMRLHTVLSELFANALEHGLLHLDSALKEEPGGFERFALAREQRLAQLQEGEIGIRLAYSGLGRISVRLRDSGAGFLLAVEQGPHDPALSGRGIALISSLCESLQYFGCGNEVEVELRAD
jgi:CheY-like chemotaxis protein